MRHRKDLVIYTYNQKDSSWESAIFEHHTTFETLAIEPQLKTTMIDDLDAFSKGKDFSRAWDALGNVDIFFTVHQVLESPLWWLL